MKRLLALISVMVIAAEAIAGIHIVNVKQTQLYKEPDANSDVIVNVQYGTQVKIMETSGDWCRVQVGKKQKGWMWGKYIEEVPEWKKVKLRTGDMPKKYAIKPIYDKTIDNYLKVSTSAKTEVIVKLMKMSAETVSFADTCVRVAYVAAGSSYEIENVPQGRYYLKVAYGREYSKTTINGAEHEGFKQYPLFELVQSFYDFKVERVTEEDGSVSESISSYSVDLTLEVAEEEEENAESVYNNHSLITEDVFSR